MKPLLLITALAVTGCTPIVELSHTSHITQHFGPDRTNYGWDVASVGVRLRPTRGVTVDVLDGYSVEEVDGRHEVFQARLLWEVGK